MAIVEERCYVLHSEFGAADYFAVYNRLGRDAQIETLGGLIGYYTTEVGELNSIVSLWRYESMEERQRRRSELAQDARWLDYLQHVRPMIRSMRNRLLVPVIDPA